MKKNCFIGIDISKKTLDVVINDSSKKHSDESNYQRIDNNAEGFRTLLHWLKAKKIAKGKVVIGMEHTGIYGFELRLFLEKHGIDYCCYMPLHLKRSLGLVRGKNDKVDAERIAYYTYLHREELVFSRLSGNTVLRLQELFSERKRLVKQHAEHEAFLTDAKGRVQTSTHAVPGRLPTCWRRKSRMWRKRCSGLSTPIRRLPAITLCLSVSRASGLRMPFPRLCIRITSRLLKQPVSMPVI